MMETGGKRILLTGATGYVGGRLIAMLEETGRPVRCVARRPELLSTRVRPGTEVVAGDLLDAESLKPAFDKVDTAYYLVHSLGAGEKFEAEEEKAAANFGTAAAEAGVRRIIYLGGLCDETQAELSPHMRSRMRTGQVLRASGVPVITFRASIILGSGSLSFELIRSLVQRLPVMVTPRWVSVPAQPIAIRDVLAYLVQALELEGEENRIYEIGGADRVSYGGLMREYARQRGLRRLMIPVPVLTPRLSSLWLHLVTPVYARIGRKLIGSMLCASVVRDDAALRDFDIQPAGVREAIPDALRKEDHDFAETHWSSALSAREPDRRWGGIHFGSRLADSRQIRVDAPPEQAFRPIQRIGGKRGWYYGTWLWRLRGILDRIAGGVGMDRGRRDPEDLRNGDVIDCWRVEAFEPPRRLRLFAEMKVPGRAWLQFEVEADNGGSRIRQTALFDPAGLSGLLYWYALYPAHQFIFRGMLRHIGKAAGQETEDQIRKRAEKGDRGRFPEAVARVPDTEAPEGDRR
jgi:uncharacterized protein YbjT (DUF2867 family)